MHRKWHEFEKSDIFYSALFFCVKSRFPFQNPFCHSFPLVSPEIVISNHFNEFVVFIFIFTLRGNDLHFSCIRHLIKKYFFSKCELDKIYPRKCALAKFLDWNLIQVNKSYSEQFRNLFTNHSELIRNTFWILLGANQLKLIQIISRSDSFRLIRNGSDLLRLNSFSKLTPWALLTLIFASWYWKYCILVIECPRIRATSPSSFCHSFFSWDFGIVNNPPSIIRHQRMALHLRADIIFMDTAVGSCIFFRPAS